MKEFFHSVKFRILICIAALLLGLMAYVAVSAGIETLPEQIISTITYPFTAAANTISDSVSGFFDKLLNADTYKAQNDELREKLSEMYGRTMDYDEVAAENARLREMLGIKERNPSFIFTEPCDITSRTAGDIYGSFTINRGSRDGISINDTVISTVGLVGRVSELGAGYATVSTILSPQMNVGVTTVRTKTTGVIENDLESAENGMCLMSNILKDADIAVGDVIVTSGQSGLFPSGIIVGTVKEVFDDANGLSKHALIEPTEDCFDVTSVFVVTDFNGKGLSFESE
ncbi:MAG: rod shape-determining protein MreC [Oscillospiraceae bacterium]